MGDDFSSWIRPIMKLIFKCTRCGTQKRHPFPKCATCGKRQ